MGEIGGSGSVCIHFPVPPIYPDPQFTPVPNLPQVTLSVAYIAIYIFYMFKKMSRFTLF